MLQVSIMYSINRLARISSFFFYSVLRKKFSPNKCWQILLGTKIRFNVYIYIYINICICVFSCLAKPSCRSYHLCDAISILACFVGNFIVDTPVIRIFHWILSIKHFCSTLLRVVFCTNLQGFLWVTSVAQYNSSIYTRQQLMLFSFLGGVDCFSWHWGWTIYCKFYTLHRWSF